MNEAMSDLAEALKRRCRLYAKFEGESGHVELPFLRIDTAPTRFGAIECSVIMFMMPRPALHFMERAVRTQQPVLFGLDCTELNGPRLLFHGHRIRPAIDLCIGMFEEVAYRFTVVEGGFVELNP